METQSGLSTQAHTLSPDLDRKRIRSMMRANFSHHGHVETAQKM